MKLVTYLLILCVTLLISCSPFPGIVPEEITAGYGIETVGDLTIYSLDSHAITIVKIPELSSLTFFRQPGKSLAEIAADSNFTLAVNGSYFDYESPRPVSRADLVFTHAGYLRIQDSVYADMMEGEKQLSTLFTYDFQNDSAGYFKLEQLDQTMKYDLVVQTGPQIIRENVVQEEEIKNSINGMGKHARTAFASVDGTEHYIIVKQKPLLQAGIDLVELGQVLLDTGFFKGNLNVVNLDGGSSTSLYIKGHPELSFHSGREILPILLCVK